MFTKFYGQCLLCPKGTKSPIKTKKLLCPKHLQEDKDSKKSPEKLAKENLKKEAKYTKASNYKTKPRKITGEGDVFSRIWNSRLHNCEVCGRPLIRKKNEVGIFSHILSKGASPQMRLDEDFILLMGDSLWPHCGCHAKWENRTENMRNMEIWKPIFLLLDEAKKIGHERRKNKPLYNEDENP